MRAIDKHHRRPFNAAVDLLADFSPMPVRAGQFQRGRHGAAPILVPMRRPHRKLGSTRFKSLRDQVRRLEASDQSERHQHLAVPLTRAFQRRSSRPLNSRPAWPMVEGRGADRMKLSQEPTPPRTVCDDCNVPVSSRACVLDRRTGKLVQIYLCPNCAKLIWYDDRPPPDLPSPLHASRS